MAKIMEADTRQPCLLQNTLKRPIDVACAEWGANLRREHQPLVVPCVSQSEPFRVEMSIWVLVPATWAYLSVGHCGKVGGNCYNLAVGRGHLPGGNCAKPPGARGNSVRATTSGKAEVRSCRFPP